MDIDFSGGMPRFTAVCGPRMEKPPTVDAVIERLVAVRADVASAEKNGIFVPLPTGPAERSRDWSRVKTIRNRLYLMGYLKADTGRGNMDGGLREAIRAFQAEAGLRIDGWVGAKESWPALQELVGFETPLRLDRWYRKEAPLPALRRAVALRLSVFGLLPWSPDSTLTDIREGLAVFGNVWRTLFGSAPEKEPVSVPQGERMWIDRLFDMDGISRRLSILPAPPDREAMKRCHGFIVNAAKIELWLMGYPVRPGGYDLDTRKASLPLDNEGLQPGEAWLKSRSVTHYFAVKRNLRFYKALHRFWRDNGDGDDTADEKSVRFLQCFRDFFILVDQGLREDARLDAGQRQRQLEAFVLKRKAQLPEVWRKVRAFGARVWDGVRRVWGWLRRMVAGGVKKVLEMGTNMARLIYDFALGSFEVAANVMRSLGAAIRWAATPRLPGSDPAHVVFQRDMDGDIRVVVHHDARRDRVREGCRRLEQFAQMFAFGCRVAGTLVSLLVEAFRSGWSAYFGLVLALIRMRRMADRLRGLVQAYREVFAGVAR